jgi:hypothetical protein
MVTFGYPSDVTPICGNPRPEPGLRETLVRALAVGDAQIAPENAREPCLRRLANPILCA